MILVVKEHLVSICRYSAGYDISPETESYNETEMRN